MTRSSSRSLLDQRLSRDGEPMETLAKEFESLGYKVDRSYSQHGVVVLTELRTGSIGAAAFLTGAQTAVRSTSFRTLTRFSQMLENLRSFSAALPQQVHNEALRHLVRTDRQEDLCFGLWNPSLGNRRLTALITDVIVPAEHERRVRGNVSFTSDYYCRALSLAIHPRIIKGT